jgi:hypothetical protein
MATDYEKVRRDNIEEYGKGTRHLEFLGRLYSDRTHFIYELLQNAEDARASKVSFLLEPGRLVFKHDGQELFNEEHVRGVCGVAEGTKAEDKTKIGKFGIGFKSVYAYTRTPEIHCGDEHFRIDHFVRPAAVPPQSVDSPWTTTFFFPFAPEAGVTTAQAFEAIKQRLATIGVHTLLFLRNLREIHWDVKGGAKGVYRTHTDPSQNHRRVTLKAYSDTSAPDAAPRLTEHWLLFTRPLSLPGKSATLNVEAAFLLAKDAKTGKEFIQRLSNAPLVVYFPTAIQTGLGFLIQGPYDATPARDNIEENNPLNFALIYQTGELIVDALRTIKELGLLTLEVLNALPLRVNLGTDTLTIFQRMTQGASREEKLFGPLTDRVARALKEEELLPAHPSGYVSGANAALARSAELRDLLDAAQLQSLLASPTPHRWLAEGITGDRTPEIRTYLVETIKVTEITPENLAQKLHDSFLNRQSDPWFAEFYAFLAGQKALWRPEQGRYSPAGPLRYAKNIIRLQNDSLVAPFRKDDHPNAFLPPEGETEFPIVKRTIVANAKAKDFLVTLGLTLPDLVDEIIEKVLIRYHRAPLAVSQADSLHDVQRIAAAAKTDSKSKRDRLMDALRKTSFLLGTNAQTGKPTFLQPAQLHFDNPETKLYLSGNPIAHFLSDCYDKTLHDFFAELGVSHIIRCSFKPPGRDGNVVTRDYYGDHARALNGFDPDFEIEGLDHALSHPTTDKSKLIWNRLLVPHSAKLKGELESSSRQDFSWSKKETTHSTVGRLASLRSWLPDRAGNWHTPKGMAFSDLPDGFEQSEAVCKHLEIEFVSVSQLAEKTGIPLTDIESLKTLIASAPQKWEEIKRDLAGGIKPKFPQRTVGNPERHEDKVRERTDGSPGKTYKQREGSVRISKPDLDPQTWLQGQYTNEDSQLVCQMCELEMPFKKRDGNYYFEAVEAFDHLPIERQEIFLALCPLCAAIYKEYVKRDDLNSATVKNSILASRETLIPVKVGQQNRTIRFVEAHLFDLRVVLDSRPPPAQ